MSQQVSDNVFTIITYIRDVGKEVEYNWMLHLSLEIVLWWICDP